MNNNYRVRARNEFGHEATLAYCDTASEAEVILEKAWIKPSVIFETAWIEKRRGVQVWEYYSPSKEVSVTGLAG